MRRPLSSTERVAGAEVAQVDRIDVAARRVAGLRVVRRVERHLAHLRDRAEQIVARQGAGRIDLRAVEHGDRQCLGDPAAPDLRADDHDVIVRVAASRPPESWRAAASARTGPAAGPAAPNAGAAQAHGADRRAPARQISSSSFSPPLNPAVPLRALPVRCCPVRCRWPRRRAAVRLRPARRRAGPGRARLPSARRRSSRRRCR